MLTSLLFGATITATISGISWSGVPIDPVGLIDNQYPLSWAERVYNYKAGANVNRAYAYTGNTEPTTNAAPGGLGRWDNIQNIESAMGINTDGDTVYMQGTAGTPTLLRYSASTSTFTPVETPTLSMCRYFAGLVGGCNKQSSTPV